MVNKLIIIVLACASSACTLTPTQKKWTTIGVSVVATGLIIAHEQDNGRGPLSSTDKNGGKSQPGQCSGASRDCK